jgi:hypothetical protein
VLAFFWSAELVMRWTDDARYSYACVDPLDESVWVRTRHQPHPTECKPLTGKSAKIGWKAARKPTDSFDKSLTRFRRLIDRKSNQALIGIQISMSPVPVSGSKLSP